MLKVECLKSNVECLMFKVEALLVSKFHAAELLYAIFLKIAAKLHFFVQICNYWAYFFRMDMRGYR